MDSADLAWLLAAFALVFLMLPGLALFYGGMVAGRNVLNMFMMVFGATAVTAVAYLLLGHGLVIGDSLGGLGLLGNPAEFLGGDVWMTDDGAGGTFWFAFFLLFAAISIAIVASGAVGRMRFGAWLAFSALWILLVYSPLAHWVFAFDADDGSVIGGWMRNQLGLHDYAGGTAVHMNAGASALALALALGPRRMVITRPHSLPLVVLGAGLLFFGWLGFNGGTAGVSDFFTSYIILTTTLAACGGILGFLVVEKLRDGHATTLGMATGLIGGLVGITPVADAVSPIGALIVGVLAAAAVAWAVTWKRRHKIDDSLDAFAVHGIGGIAGSLFVVFFGAAAAPAGVAGVFFGGDASLIWRESVAIIATIAYSFGMTYAIAWVMNKIRPIRVSAKDEDTGLDQALHAETAYTH